MHLLISTSDREKMRTKKIMHLVSSFGDELYFVLLRKMHVSWCCFFFKVLKMASGFSWKNKRRNVRTQDLDLDLQFQITSEE